MYQFVCTGRPSHISHSAAKETRQPECPTCGESTILATKIVEMHLEGASVLDICAATGVSAPAVRDVLSEEAA